ncbi:MAG TPA: hypothetical protein VF597_01160 [Candidatus Saccharimonadales bacterium]
MSEGGERPLHYVDEPAERKVQLLLHGEDEYDETALAGVEVASDQLITGNDEESHAEIGEVGTAKVHVESGRLAVTLHAIGTQRWLHEKAKQWTEQVNAGSGKPDVGTGWRVGH